MVAGKWFGRHKIMTVASAVFVLIVVIANTAGGNDDYTNPIAAPGSSDRATTSTHTTPTSKARPLVTAAPAPIITTKQVAETLPIAHGAATREDATMAAGTSAITTSGADGIRTLTYEVVYADGLETSRTLLSDVVTTAAVDEVTSVGTYVAPPPPPPPPPPPAEEESGCDPNYSGGCVPIDSDVDCAGGSGNGPSYVQGPVTVVGSDIYGLDSDGDGVGCES